MSSIFDSNLPLEVAEEWLLMTEPLLNVLLLTELFMTEFLLTEFLLTLPLNEAATLFRICSSKMTLARLFIILSYFIFCSFCSLF